MSDGKSKGKGRTRWTREFKLRARCPICTNASALAGAYVNDEDPHFVASSQSPCKPMGYIGFKPL